MGPATPRRPRPRRGDRTDHHSCGDACPVHPGTRYEDWELDDPAGLALDEVRPVRDDIGDRVRGLLAGLGPERVGS